MEKKKKGARGVLLAAAVWSTLAVLWGTRMVESIQSGAADGLDMVLDLVIVVLVAAAALVNWLRWFASPKKNDQEDEKNER